MIKANQLFFLISLLTFSQLSFASTKLEKCMTNECIEMFKNFKKYARHDMPIAMEALGNFYMNGYGVEQNEKKALKYYEHTAKYGSATAQYKAGLLYILGKEAKNIDRGLTWLKWSVKNGNSDAAYYLGVLYIEGKKVDKNFIEAKRWLDISVEKGHANSQYLLAQLYENGTFGEDEKSKSIDLYTKSAFKVEASKDKLKQLNIALPEQVDDGIEHIEVNPLPFFEMLGLKLAGLRNYPTPAAETGSKVISPSCRNSKINCGRVNIISDPNDLRRFIRDTRNSFDAATSSRLQ